MAHGMDAASHALGGKEEKPKKEIREIRTRKAKSGGYVHEHHHSHPEHHAPEEHVSADQDAMMQHMASAMGQPNPGEGQDADAAPADPAAAAGAGAPPAAAVPGA